MKYLIYLSQVVNRIGTDFEFWAAYESSLIEAVVGLVIYQFLEDFVLCMFKAKDG
jgi:hypothetical protein